MVDAVPISGEIDPKAFPFLLMDLHRNGATGSLKVEGPAYQKALYFRSGRVLFGSSNDPRDQLGSILIESGKISPEQLEDVNSKVGPGSPLAKVLSESGFVSQRELSDAARAKVERILGDVIGYTQGNFEFEDGVLPKGAVDLKLSPERLVLASVLRVSDRAFVLRHLGSLETVLNPVASEAARLGEIRPDTGGLAEALDGHRTLKEAAALTRLDEFEAAKIACALLFLGIMRRASEGEKAGDFDLAQTARMAFEPTAPTIIEPSPSTLPFAESAPVAAPEPSVDPAIFMPPPAENEEIMVSASTSPPVNVEPEPPPPPPPPRATTPPSLPLIHATNQPPPRARPQPTPATKEELAALDSLLKARPHEGPLAPLEKPQANPNWEPRFGPARKETPRRSVVLPLLVVLLVLAGGGSVVALRPWTYIKASTRPTPPKPAPVTTTLSAVPSPVADPSLASPSPPQVTLAAATPVPPPSLATPRPTGPRKPEGEKVRKDPSGGADLSEARSLLERGSLADAAQGFASSLKQASASSYSIQLLVACSDDTVRKAVKNVPGQEFFILPVSYKGRSCYRLCWGVYEDGPRAESAIQNLPEYFRKGGAQPKALKTSGLLP